jgi:hypothetical protein
MVYVGRDKVLKIEGGYHGTHDAAEISMSPALDETGPLESPGRVPSTPGLFKGVIEDVLVAPFNNIEATAGIIERNRANLAAVIVYAKSLDKHFEDPSLRSIQISGAQSVFSFSHEISNRQDGLPPPEH